MSAVRKVYKKHLMVKLSPNVTDIAEIAKVVEGNGADSISLINTILAMAIDAESRKPVLSTVTGGLSGPAIKPVALAMVWRVAAAVKIPVIGGGGISRAEDAIEFLMAGASAVEIGTAALVNPKAPLDIVKGIENYMLQWKMTEISQLIGAARR